MARIRTIKPEFTQSETIGKLSRDARLLFIQLWTFVDDEGRARAASRMLASLLYPYDEDAQKLIESWLDELEASGCVRLYEVDGDHYLEVCNWLKHQKIDRPTKSRLPSFAEGSSKPREDSRKLATDLGPRTLDQDLGKDQDASRAADAALEPVDEDPKAKLYRVGKTILTSFGVGEKRTGSLIGMWLKQRPDPVGLLAAIQYARDHNVAEPVAYLSTLINSPEKPNGHGKQHVSELAFEIARDLRDRQSSQDTVRPADTPGSS